MTVKLLSWGGANKEDSRTRRSPKSTVDATTFTKNRDRLLAGDIAEAFFTEVLAQIRAEGPLSGEQFTADGTLLEVSASHKSFKPKDDRQRELSCQRGWDSNGLRPLKTNNLRHSPFLRIGSIRTNALVHPYIAPSSA
jgi:hypothetical protein